MSMVQIDLLIFAHPDQALPLANQFDDFGRRNIQPSYENEQEGYFDTLSWPSLGQIQAYRGLRWTDMDIEEVIDQWVEDNQGLLPFAIVMRYQNPINPGHSLLSWISAPGSEPQTIGDIPDADLPDLGSWETPIKALLEAAVPCLLSHPHASSLRTCVENKILDQSTVTAASVRRGARI